MLKPNIPFEAICNFCRSMNLPTCKAENLILSRDLLVLQMMPLADIMAAIDLEK